MQDIKSVDPKIQLQTPDGFSDPTRTARSPTARTSASPVSRRSADRAGATFVKSFGKQIGTTPNPYSAYGAQAMDVLLQAIAKGGGQRARRRRACSA